MFAKGSGETGSEVKGTGSFPKDLSSVPSTHMVAIGIQVKYQYTQS